MKNMAYETVAMSGEVECLLGQVKKLKDQFFIHMFIRFDNKTFLHNAIHVFLCLLLHKLINYVKGQKIIMKEDYNFP